MKLQMRGSLVEPDGTKWYAGITGEGNLIEFTLMSDTSQEVLGDIKCAVRHTATIEIDIIDVAKFRRIAAAPQGGAAP